MKKLSNIELSKLSMTDFIRLYVPKFKASGYRSFWVDAYFREANELHPGKDVKYWANELVRSPQAMLWLTKDDINEAIEWTQYCKAHNH